ncbi:hypothetical protein DBR43_26075 [Pedobacter sp. KBW06]|uniref:hypothetical protein n=1 Tax=Pedobacter sp. KBW06 TaxID=2153359 RepID=UPI000F5AC996|nr:hypothetical protein [Pedobacter sp. KBW06]RQO67977.1 hypothetical protein DBR43_26075 [Pedobacter sp. KBW06]
MIIYNRTWLKNLDLQNQLKRAHRLGDITAEELKQMEEKYPVGFYTPNIFVRAGLFILTQIITSFAGGLLSLIFSSMGDLITSPGYFLFLGLISYVALELIVQQKHHFRSGVDDALMWTAAGLILAAFIGYLSIAQRNSLSAPFECYVFFFAMVLAGYFTLRFADMLMAVVSFLSLICFLFFSRELFGFYAAAIRPFLIILVSAGVYFLCVYWKKYKDYENCLTAMQVFCLLIGYAAGNYFVVKEMGSMINQPLQEGEGLPLGWFFWTWTIALPFVYIALGLKRKEVILLRSGLILIAAAAFTFRNYYHVMPIEGALSLVGAALLAIAYGVIRYLKTPKKGFTYEELDDDQLLDKIKVESLIVGETFSGPSAAPEGSRMGGGSFGGGGSSADF